MKKTIASLCLLFLALTGARGNDGVFYAQGNQLIPIKETDITVRKEILTINRVGKSDYVEVIVYYEFFNPTGKAKTILVGFEAASPYPYDGLLRFPEQPNIHDFQVVMNGQLLPYQVAHVQRELCDYDKTGTSVPPYYVNGKVQDWSRKQCEDAIKESNDESYPFNYVYHFNAEFRPGVNTVRHTYRFQLSESIDMTYQFPYVLTAARRWANGQIDDFTLNINMGDCESFCIYPTFFKEASEWTLTGVGRTDISPFGGEDSPRFHIREGGISFHKLHFRPEGELTVFQERADWSVYSDEGPVLSSTIVAAVGSFYYDWSFLLGPDYNIRSTPADARILRNLPFAHRGYVFKSADLQNFFASSAWYVPNPDYVPDMEKLTTAEQRWVSFWKK